MRRRIFRSVLLLALFTVAPASAQVPSARGDADCDDRRSAADIIAAAHALGGAAACDNGDCDRDGTLTAADVACTAGCLFGSCPIPDHAPGITSITPELGSGIAPFSTVRVAGTGFGTPEEPKFVTIGGLPAELIDADDNTLLVLVPVLDPGPTTMVVSAGTLDSPPFSFSVVAAGSVGDPDTFAAVLDLVENVVDRFSLLPLELLYDTDATLVRDQLTRLIDELDAQSAALAADPSFTAEVRARLDAAIDSSEVGEELRDQIADLDALLQSGDNSEGTAHATAPAIAVEALRKARTLKVIAAAVNAAATTGAAAGGAVISAPALIAIGVATAIAAGIVVVASDPLRPLILDLQYTDANGARRPYPTAGGSVRIIGARFDAITSGLRFDAAIGAFDVRAEEVVTIPDRYGLCGPGQFTLLRTVGDIRSNSIPSRIQPELLGLGAERARNGESISVQTRGTYGCDTYNTFNEMGPNFFPRQRGIEQFALRQARMFVLDVLPGSYLMDTTVANLQSKERIRLDVSSAITGISVSCNKAELETGDETACIASPIPGDAGFAGVTISFESNDPGLTIEQIGGSGSIATAVGRLPSESAQVVAKGSLGPNRTLTSQPFTIKVVDTVAPSVFLSRPSATEVAPGGSVDFMVLATDGSFVTRVVLRATGDAVLNPVQEVPCPDLEPECRVSFSVQTAQSGFTENDVRVVAEAFDGFSHMGQSDPQTFMIRAASMDMQPPTVDIQQPADGGKVRAGDTVQVSVRLTDNMTGDSGVKRVRVEASGPAVATGPTPAELTLPAALPQATRLTSFTIRSAAEVANLTNKTITITATGFDDAGNMATDTNTVTVGGAPVITSVSPSPVNAGANIRIIGEGFGENQGSSTVTIGGTASGLAAWSNNEVLALVPEDSTGMVTVVITVDGLASNAFPLTVLGSGDVQIQLIWNDTNDLDLHVIDPNGDEISFEQRMSPSGGKLDVDANAGCNGTTSSPRENVFWPTGAAPIGTYNVSVVYYEGCTEPAGPSTFTINAFVDGSFMTLLEGSISSGSRSVSFTRAAPP